MLDASDALRAHVLCKKRLAEILGAKSFHAPYFCELAPDQECLVARFIRENTGDPDLEPEVTQLRTAHAAMHCAVIQLAQMRSGGQPVDVGAAFGSDGEVGKASTTMIDTIWRIENKLRVMAY